MFRAAHGAKNKGVMSNKIANKWLWPASTSDCGEGFFYNISNFLLPGSLSYLGWGCFTMSSLLALHLFAFLFAYWILLQSTAKCWRIIPLTIPHICHFSPRAQFLVTFFTKSILYGVHELRILVVAIFGFCSSHLQCNAMQLQSINLYLHFRKRDDCCHWEGSQRLLTWWV